MTDQAVIPPQGNVPNGSNEAYKDFFPLEFNRRAHELYRERERQFDAEYLRHFQGYMQDLGGGGDKLQITRLYIEFLKQNDDDLKQIEALTEKMRTIRVNPASAKDKSDQLKQTLQTAVRFWQRKVRCKKPWQNPRRPLVQRRRQQ